MLIDVYLPSLYWENLNKYEQKYHEVQKQKNECTDDMQRDVLDKELKSLYKKKFALGYFRDGYDGFNLFQTMGLDYAVLVFPFLDSEFKLPIEKVKELEKIVVDSKVDENFKPARNPMAGFIVGEAMTPKKIQNAKLKLTALLKAAIKRNEPVLFKVTGGVDLTEEQKAKILKDLGVPD